VPSWFPALPLEARERAPLRVADITNAIQTQARVIWALILRETISRYGEHKIGFLWAFIEPFLMVMVFVLIFAVMRSDSPGGMPLIQFMLTGIVAFGMFKDPMTQMVNAISQNRTLLAFPLGIGFGFLFSSLEPIIPSVKQLTALLMGRPLFLSSGLFFVADAMPVQIREYVLYNPVLHSMELLRSEYFYEYETMHGDWGYLSAWSFGTLAVGLAVHRGLRRKVYAN